MRESVTYQAVLAEGREEGREEERRLIAINLLQEGFAIERIAGLARLSIAQITQLKQENHL